MTTKADIQELVIDGKVYIPKENLSVVWNEIKSLDNLCGKNIFFRTVTYHILGRVINIINGKWLHLESASWIADSGRFMNCVKEGTLSEVEPIGTHFLNLDSVTDFFPWAHPLPTEQK